MQITGRGEERREIAAYGAPAWRSCPVSDAPLMGSVPRSGKGIDDPSASLPPHAEASGRTGSAASAKTPERRTRLAGTTLPRRSWVAPVGHACGSTVELMRSVLRLLRQTVPGSATPRVMDREPRMREKLVSALRSGPFNLGGYRINYAPGSNSGSNYVEVSVVGDRGHILN